VSTPGPDESTTDAAAAGPSGEAVTPPRTDAGPSGHAVTPPRTDAGPSGDEAVDAGPAPGTTPAGATPGSTGGLHDDRPVTYGRRRGDRRRRQRDGWIDRAAPIALGVAAGLLLAQAVTGVIGAVSGLITVVVISMFLSFAMEPAVQWMHRRGIRRGIGTWLVFLSGLLFFGTFLAAMAPLVVDQVTTMVQAGPGLLGQIAGQIDEWVPGETGTALAEWLREQQQALPDALPGQIGLLGRGALGLGQTVLGGVFLMLTVGLVTFYLVADGPRLRFRLARRLSHREQVRVLGLWELAIAKTGGYVYSRVLIAVASAAFHVVVFTLIGLEYALALGMWMGVISSVIPVIGTYLGGALPLVVALAASPARALAVLLVITVYQQLENYLIMPRITSHTMQLHPAVAFLSVLAGGALAGATGALLALPAVAIAAALISASSEEYDVLEHHLVETGPVGAAIVSGEADAPDEHGPDHRQP
jgi:predicted PurR-regulated permease PerM